MSSNYKTYPKGFPCVMIDGFTIDVDMALLRSTPRGLPIQRRFNQTMHHQFRIKFTIERSVLSSWQEWMRYTYGSWFMIDLPSMYSGRTGTVLSPHLVRLTSEITLESKGPHYFTASMQVELAPSHIASHLEVA